MKNHQTKIILLLAFGLFAFSQTIRAQTDYTIKEPKSNHIKLSGTSSLHDWNMNAHTFTGKAEFDFKKGDDLTLTGIHSLTFSLPVTNLKSDKKGLDKNAYEALNSDKYKNITYTLSSARVSPEKDGKFLIKSMGKLTIAGVTKEAAMDVYCVVNKDASIRCSGTETLKMSDYKVQPPSFFLGAMKTGDDLKLDFNIAFAKN
jgi:polyisoprenoid-binding protein YceI